MSEILSNLTWRQSSDGHELVLSSDDVEKIQRDYLSPSSAASIMKCPASLAIDRLFRDKEESPFEATALGSRAHEVMEFFYQLPHKDRTKRRARALVTEVVDKISLERIERLMMMTEVWKRVRRLWEIEDPTKVLVRRTEWKLENFSIPTPHGDVPFTGVIDRVDIVGGETSVGSAPVDYKAGKGRPYYPRDGQADDKAHQIRLYAAAMEEFDGRLPIHGKLYFTMHGKVRSVSLQRQKVNETRDWFGTAWGVMQNTMGSGVFPATPNSLCNWCPAATSCPAFLASLSPDVDEAKAAAVVKSAISILDTELISI